MWHNVVWYIANNTSQEFSPSFFRLEGYAKYGRVGTDIQRAMVPTQHSAAVCNFLFLLLSDYTASHLIRRRYSILMVIHVRKERQSG
jgi:hypothetical protein